MKRILCTLFLVVGMLFTATSANAVLSETEEHELAGIFRTLRRFQEPFSLKRKAVMKMKMLYEKTGDKLIIEYAVNLLKYSYDYPDFDEQNNLMFYNDQIARELIAFVGEAKAPEGFEIMVVYVMKMNHTDATIRQVWWAIQQIDWNKTNQ